jgi:endonuclease/exonuclease/phosphatase family metal-dependent hydrolase
VAALIEAEQPDEFAMKMLRGEDTHDGVTGDLIDAWSQAETSDGFTIPSDGPDRRIDYIYAFPGSGTATDCKTVLEQPSNGLRASDHLGVICAFE